MCVCVCVNVNDCSIFETKLFSVISKLKCIDCIEKHTCTHSVTHTLVYTPQARKAEKNDCNFRKCARQGECFIMNVTLVARQ